MEKQYLTEEEFVDELVKLKLEEYALEECDRIGYKVRQKEGQNVYPKEVLEKAHFKLFEEGILDFTETN